MKRMNERIEQQIKKLGLKETDLDAVDMVMQIEEEEEAKNKRSERAKNSFRRDIFGGSSPGVRKTARNLDLDGNHGRGLTSGNGTKNGSLNSNVNDVVYISSDDNIDEMDLDHKVPAKGKGKEIIRSSSDDIEILHHKVPEKGKGKEIIISSSDEMDLDHKVLAKDKGKYDSNDDMEILDNKAPAKSKGKETDAEPRPFRELVRLLAGNDISLDSWADRVLGDIKEEIRVRMSDMLQTDPLPVMTRSQLAEPVVIRDSDDYHRQYLRERARELARPELPGKSSVVATEKERLVDGKDFKQFKNYVGPFSEALMVIRKRTSKTSAEDLIEWKPSTKIPDQGALVVPSLLHLSLKVISENADNLVSLESVPYFLRKKLSDLLCDMRKMNVEYFNLLMEGCPTEIRVKNCSLLTDEQFQQSFGSCQTENLRVLQLDLCGQFMFDFALRNVLARSSNSFRSLVIISLRGTCRLTDHGVKLLVTSASSLLSINLGHCSLITSKAIISIAISLGSNLRELFIDGCDQIDAKLIIPAIKKFKKLEVLSVAGILDVSDKFVCHLVLACGRSIKELDFAGCSELTDVSLKAIGDFCAGLSSLDISDLPKVTDLGMEYLASGCRTIQRLKLSQTRFSDEATAAFLETSGKSLVELILNRVVKVGPNTAFSLARHSRKLLYLDVSWCRRISEKALGLIVDSCSSLMLLKLFGCKQITEEFLKGHSNKQVRIVGLMLDSLCDHLNLLEPEEVFLRYSPLPSLSES